MYEKTYNFDGTVSFRFDGILVDRDELAALREAVEVLEDMYAQRDAETEKWFQKWMGEFSDHFGTKRLLGEIKAKIQEANSNSAPGLTYLAAVNDLTKTRAALREAEAKVAELHAQLEGRKDSVKLALEMKNKWADRAIKAEGDIQRMRGMAADETGDRIVSLVRDGYGVTVRPGFSERSAAVTVEKVDGDTRHATTRHVSLADAPNATPARSALAYTIKSAYLQLLNSIRPKTNHAMGDFFPSAEWVKANPGFFNRDR